MGVNTWLMKGFFDTIPRELDESAKVDGATRAQIFCASSCRSPSPILAVVALLSFIFTLNEFVVACVLLQTTDNEDARRSGCASTSTSSTAQLGAVRGRRAARRHPRDGAVPWPAAASSSAGSRRARSRDERRRASRSAASLLAEPHHDGSDRYVSSGPTSSAARAPCACACRADAVDQVVLRSVVDGEPRVVAAASTSETETRDVVAGDVEVGNPGSRYRWLLSGGDVGYAWLNGRARRRTTSPTRTTSLLDDRPRRPRWHLGSVVYEIFPDRFATPGAGDEAAATGRSREWGDLPTGRGRGDPRELYGGDLAGVEQHLDHVERSA